MEMNLVFSFQTDILLNVFLAIAVDNLADADSLTTIEKEGEEGGDEAAAENEVAAEENEVGEEGNLSRHESRRSRRKKSTVAEEIEDAETAENMLERRWSTRRSKSGLEEEVNDAEKADEGECHSDFQVRTRILIIHAHTYDVIRMLIINAHDPLDHY